MSNSTKCGATIELRHPTETKVRRMGKDFNEYTCDEGHRHLILDGHYGPEVLTIACSTKVPKVPTTSAIGTKCPECPGTLLGAHKNTLKCDNCGRVYGPGSSL